MEPVRVNDHIFWIIDDNGETPEAMGFTLVDILEPQMGGATIYAGIAFGQVNVEVEAHDSLPAVNLDGWEEVVEVSLPATATLLVGSLMNFGPEFPPLNPQGPGDYRIRLHVNHRGHNWDGVDFEPVEEYLIQAWPSPPAPNVIYKMIDPRKTWGT